MDQYLKTMGTLGMHAGLVGFGEHYNSQFVNQTMSCVVFEYGGEVQMFQFKKTGKKRPKNRCCRRKKN